MMALNKELKELIERNWCPAGKHNGFKWQDATREDGIWTLTAEECKQIAYVTTHQYAFVLLQHNALASL